MIYRWQRYPSDRLDLFCVNLADKDGRYFHYLYRLNLKPLMVLSMATRDEAYARRVFHWFLQNYEQVKEGGVYIDSAPFESPPYPRLELIPYAV